MSRVCEICLKSNITGYKVSHSNRHTKRKWFPNLRRVKINDSYIRICSRCLKKYGVQIKLATAK
jgi:large subunit ribosomal protein L28